MRHPLHIAATAAAVLIASAGLAAAASSGSMATDHSAAKSTAKMSTIVLTTSERKTIWKDLSSASEQKAPAKFQAAVGTDIPKSVTLRAFPKKVADSVSTLSGMKYAKLNDKVLVVRPRDRKIESVITAASAKS
ncbi:MAG: DUF1236 domain-containing protein [Pseudolabrys sp.]